MARAVAAVLVAVALLMTGPVPLSAQCAMCRTLLATPEGQQLAAGLRHGIVLLLVAPFLAFGAVAAVAIRSHRRTARMQDDAAATSVYPS